ncbi:MAG: HPr family phosphocarrier protein [Lachnospiraceae bacterium]|nr:HPr family phosphocarrier protein [Lachnospiraceae bacterium]
MKEFSYTIKDELGIHARPAGLLVKEAAKYPCDVTLKCGEKKGSAKKIMAVMAMGVKKDNEVTVVCEGDKEEEAAAALQAFFEANL